MNNNYHHNERAHPSEFNQNTEYSKNNLEESDKFSPKQEEYDDRNDSAPYRGSNRGGYSGRGFNPRGGRGFNPRGGRGSYPRGGRGSNPRGGRGFNEFDSDSDYGNYLG